MPDTKIDLRCDFDFRAWNDIVKQQLARGRNINVAIRDADMFIAARQERLPAPESK